jgi:hypothetical protein
MSTIDPATAMVFGSSSFAVIERSIFSSCTGSEIVQRDPHPQTGQFTEGFDRRVVGAHEHRLGHLDHQVAGADTGLTQSS